MVEQAYLVAVEPFRFGTKWGCSEWAKIVVFVVQMGILNKDFSKCSFFSLFHIVL